MRQSEPPASGPPMTSLPPTASQSVAMAARRRPPGLRLHKRTMKVQSASAELHGYLLTFQQGQELTDVEMLGILIEHQQRITTWMLRAERHPDDPARKADEA